MQRRFYRTGQFAARACVSLRTLRYYDRVGLLSPSQHTEAGYRLYTEEDLSTLQQILALKFLGFSLEEIKQCLRNGPRRLEAGLAQQRAMLLDKRRQIDGILNAITHTESLLKTGQRDWEAIVKVIEQTQMEQKKVWVKKYFTDTQAQKMDQLSHDSYSPEARQKLQQRGEWTEEDQKRADERWAYVASETKRLAAAGADPGGDEGQALAKIKSDLLFEFTQGDPDIVAGLKRFWENHNALPTGEQPLFSVVPSTSDAETEFMEKAMTLYEERQKGNQDTHIETTL